MTFFGRTRGNLYDIYKSTSTSTLPLFQLQAISEENSWEYSTVIGYRQKYGKIDLKADY